MRRPIGFTKSLAAIVLIGAGCAGQVNGTDNPGPDDTTPMSGTGGKHGPGGGLGGNAGGGGHDVVTPPPMATPGQAALRRLTNLEYNNTLRDLLGVKPPNEENFVPDQEAATSGFSKGGSITSSAEVSQFFDASNEIADAVKAKLESLLPCSPLPTEAAAQDACAMQFITGFGVRAFRRPVNPDEAADLMAVYSAQRASAVGADFPTAMLTVIAAILQSPYFLYHWELGQAPAMDGALVRFNSYEIASRLSYFFWASMPDETLFKAAADDKLQTPDEISAQATRLLADPRAKDAIRDFNFQWLSMIGVEAMTKDATLFPNYDQDVGNAMVTEMAAFVTDDANGSLDALLNSPSAVVNQKLAKLYGVSGVSGDVQTVSLAPAERSGILTRGAFLASKANAGEAHPIYRGVSILHGLLCSDIGKPENKEIPPLPERLDTQTTREHFSAHATDPFCASCHATIDPIGFAFEHYDAVGGFMKDMEPTPSGMMKPVDSSGTIDLDGKTKTFANAIELSKLLSQAEDVRSCMARQWLRYGLHRREVGPDTKTKSMGEDPVLSYMGDAFKSSSYDIRTMMVAFTRTQAFTHRMPSPGEGN